MSQKAEKPLQVYNTLTNKVEIFKPTEVGKVKMYVCGPTVYNYLHIGNFRGPIFFNVVRNWLDKSGYDVTYVYNYTDVDDKIIKKANEEGVESIEVSERYIKEFEKDFNRLGLSAHDHNPKVTDFIQEIITFVDDLVKNEAAYVIDGEVFFEINKFDEYGKLSGKRLEDLIQGQRVEVDERKRSPADFVLWKPSKDGEPSWDSPWGKGRPGWHIECSAMIQTILGKTIDIHGGGIDLIFPHHENEIAQGEGRTCKPYCNYWMHNNFINLNDQKMSKSLGNVILGRDFMDRYGPEVMKYVMLSVHYRSMLSITDDKIHDAIAGLSRVYSALFNAQTVVSSSEETGGKVNSKIENLINQETKKIADSLNDDFNTTAMVASIFEVVRAFNAQNLHRKKVTTDSVATAQAFMSWIKEQGDVLALFSQEPSSTIEELQNILIKEKNIDIAKVEDLVVARNAARDAKDWAKADEIRDELTKLGVELQDGTGSRQWTVRL